MFGWFGGKKKELPRFEALVESGIGHLYFSRAATWLAPKSGRIRRTQPGEICVMGVMDGSSPRVITMDPWPQRVFLDADGQRTVARYVRFVASEYRRGRVPAQLDEMLVQVIREAVDELKILRLTPEPVKLPYYLELPIQEQDRERAMKEMVADGFIPPADGEG